MAYLIALLSIAGPVIIAFQFGRTFLQWVKLHRKACLVFAGLTILYGALSTVYIFKTERVSGHDNFLYHLPLFTLFLSSLKNFHEIPLWLPQVANGMPSILFGTNWYLWLVSRFPFYTLAMASPIPWDAVTLYKLNLVLNCFLFTGGMYLLLNELFPNRWAVLWGVILSLFSGVTSGALAQEQLSASGLFIPLLLFLAIRGLKTRSALCFVLFGSFFGQALSNHNPHLVLYVISIFAVAYLIAYWKVRPDFTLTTKAFALSVPIALILFSAPLYSYFKYSKVVNSPRREGALSVGYEDIRRTRNQNSLSPTLLLSYLIPRTIIGDADQPLVKNHIQEDRAPYYLGILGTLLALLAIVAIWNRRKVFWLLSAIFILLFALGDNSFVYYLLFNYVPFSRLQRIPIHMGNFMNISLIVLSCMGFEWLLQRLKRPRLAYVLVTICLIDLSTLFLTVTNLLFPIPIHPVDPYLRKLSTPRFPIYQREESDPYWKDAGKNGLLLSFKDSSAYLIRKNFHSNPDTDQFTMLNEDMSGTNRVSWVGPTGKIEGHRQTLNHMTLKVNVPETTNLAWLMNYHPSWVAKINGVPVPVESAKPYIMGIGVPAGTHEVTWEYRQRWEKLLIGLNITLIFLSIYGLLFLLAGLICPKCVIENPFSG